MIDELKQEISERIAATGETVAGFARGAGVPQPVLHRFLKGERGIGIKTAEKLSKYLKLKLGKRK